MKGLAWYSVVLIVYCTVYNLFIEPAADPTTRLGMVMMIPVGIFAGIYLWKDKKQSSAEKKTE